MFPKEYQMVKTCKRREINSTVLRKRQNKTKQNEQPKGVDWYSENMKSNLSPAAAYQVAIYSNF